MTITSRLVLTLLIQALAALAAVSPSVIAPVAFRELGLGTEAWLGVYIALVYLSSMFSTLISGDSIARFGPIRVSQFALVACALGVAVIAIGRHELLVLAPLLIGLGYGLITPAGSQILVTGPRPRSMGLVFSAKQTGVPLGGLLAGLAIPGVIGLAGWRTAIVGIVILCLLVAGGIQWARALLDAQRDPRRHVRISQLTDSLRGLRANPAAMRLASSSFLFASMQLCVITFLVSYLTHSFEMSLVGAGALMSVAQTGGIVGRVVWGWITDFSITARAMLIGLALVMSGSAVALGLLRGASPGLLVTITVLVLGASAIGWNGVFLAEVARVAPQAQVGAVTGGALFFTYFGVVVGPPIFSAVLSVTGSYAASFNVIAAGVFVGSLWFLLRPSTSNHNSCDRENQ